LVKSSELSPALPNYIRRIDRDQPTECFPGLLPEGVEHVIGRGFNVKYGPRRTGDSPVLVADNALAKETIGWSPRHDLKSMIDTASNWHSNYMPV
jgi:nucleoside-diphosphate-sugar epimerase